MRKHALNPEVPRVPKVSKVIVPKSLSPFVPQPLPQPQPQP